MLVVRYLGLDFSVEPTRIKRSLFGGAPEAVLAAVYGDAELDHELAHCLTGVIKGGSLVRKLGSPHPVSTALDVLQCCW